MISSAFPELPIVILCDPSHPDFALELVRRGAQDFLLNYHIGIPELMAQTICYAIEQKQGLNEKNALQNQLIQAEKLDSLGRIAAGVAHEVRNPLATIQVGLSYLSSLTEEFNNESYTYICEELTASIERAEEIIAGMVDFSRNDTLKRERTALESAVDRGLGLIKYDLVKSHTSVDRPAGETVPATAMIDSQKMTQVLINLIRNSIQAMASAEVEDRRIQIRTFSEKPSEIAVLPGLLKWAEKFEVKKVAVLELRDSGPGVENDKLAEIFEPFITSKIQGEGTGLGLSVVLNIVNLHEGLIRVKTMTRPSGLRTRLYFKTPA